ncbi:MAG: ParB/RepB/Spo0J family partition protein [Legionellales bacterium]|nr:ParB/RepB/Spo0J family partition protein [Legionellales bacterium]
MTKRKKFGISKTLTSSLSHTVKVASSNLGTLRHEIVPISLIELDPCNPRKLLIQKEDTLSGIEKEMNQYAKKKSELESLESLKNSIIEQGVLNPVWIYKYDTHYRLIMGERRVLASLLAGKSDIPAKILEEKPVNSDLRLLQWVENLERADLTLWERITNIKLILDAKKEETTDLKISPTYIKNLLGCSLPHAMNYFAVVFCQDQLKYAIQEGKINNLEKAALLANLNDNDIFEEVYSLCISGASLKHLQSVVRAKKIKPVLNRKGKTIIKNVNRSINLGYCSDSGTLKTIVDVLLQDGSYSRYSTHFLNLDWSDCSKVSKAFRAFILDIESNYEK